MGAQLRVYKQKISTAQTTKKITKAMELIAASRIQKAMARVRASSPFARAVTRAVSAVATHSNVDHPLTREREVDPPLGGRDLRVRPRPRGRVQLADPPRGPRAGRAPAPAGQGAGVLPRRPQGRRVLPVPSHGRARRSGRATPTRRTSTRPRRSPRPCSTRTTAAATTSGVDEIHLVYNRFVSMMTQSPETVRLLPLEVVEAEEQSIGAGVPAVRVRAGRRDRAGRAPAGVHPEPRLQRPPAVVGREARRDAEGDEVARATTPTSSSPTTPACATTRARPRSRSRSPRSSAAPTLCRRASSTITEREEAMSLTAEKTETAVVGRVARVTGPVVDIEFPHDSIPDIYNALKTTHHDRRRARPRSRSRSRSTSATTSSAPSR